jgi:uncharacterized membrane protein HdeD (DUF308 family)
MSAGGSKGERLLATLGRNWWMIGARGALAIAFGVLLLLRPGTPLDRVVSLFGLYATLDGVWTMAAALWVVRTALIAWPVLLEGAVSFAIGVLAQGWPLVPREQISAIATWAVLTGVLEIMAGVSLPRRGPKHWLLAIAGGFSIFLAALVLMLPYDSQPHVVGALGAYGLAFGIALLGVAASLRGAAAPGRRRTPAR